MLHDSQTDLVFLPMALRLHFPRLYRSLTSAFQTAHVNYLEIPHTESKTHLWARDYMPITVDKRGDLAQFRYDPDYLLAPRYAGYKPDMVPIWESLEMSPFRYEDIVLDGGNVLADKQGCVYMTDKIFLENPHIPYRQLKGRLKEILNAKNITFFHWDKKDMCGHVDGLIAISDEGEWIQDLGWEYLNFLRVKDCIFMAQLNRPTDEAAIRRIEAAFPTCKVYPIKHTQTITKHGGGLHCITWNTVAKGYQNVRVFKTSKRHPFNPFDEEAFTESRLRAVIEHDMGRLNDDEWKAFNKAFLKYWNGIWVVGEPFSFWEMVDGIYYLLDKMGCTYFRRDRRLEIICNVLTTYLMHIPGLIPPENHKG